MDDFLKGVYVSEVKKQCEFGLAAVSYLNHALHQIHNDALQRDEQQFYHSEVFRQTHSLLTHASNVSRMFWPPLPKQKKNETDEHYESRLLNIDKVVRGRALKSEYGLDDSNPLKNRSLRDHLEHYDERLDHWRNNSVNRNILSDTIGPPNAVVGLAESDMMRWFDPTRSMFRFRGEEYDLQAIASSIDQLLVISRRLQQELWDRRVNRSEHSA
ncbi:hypothetical protein EGC76_11840 [Pseudidiomarina gelatinasegens]|jgi:hypothetical protein|uniref:Uncharacterized protein n=1 Tax=Pseudidiomarina gelatinasegens TaxID=2487740 RepID=A0A443YVG1_9GAMM|nr:hypothetical protein [Pseudidiomarina gelatinasegens]RWU07920.1 hypothetical protein EGC76_11840 [Pseudidiomarina gelatinasegens]